MIPVDPKRFSQDMYDRIVDINNAIKAWAPTKTTTRSPIAVVDNWAGFDPVTDTVEGEHPNDSGNKKMANGFFSATKSAIQSVS